MNGLHYVGSESGRRYEIEQSRWIGDGGELLDLCEFAKPLNREALTDRPKTMWRYQEVLPPLNAGPVSLGEGLTPLVPVSIDRPRLLAKVDYLMPTLSFKDRGAVMLAAVARALGAERLVADSSGNAGAAIAAYAARAGIRCEIFVPGATSRKKVAQIEAHGARVIIAGTREDAGAAARRAAVDGIFYASHVYNPFFFQGTKTYVFEIWEQLGGRLPDVLVLPVGNGTLVLGVHLGCQELLRFGLVDRIPRIVAVQAEACSPLTQAFQQRWPEAKPVRNLGTRAEGIAIAAPPRHKQILKAVRSMEGQIVAVPDEALEESQRALSQSGLYVEITSAVNYAVLRVHAHLFHESDVVVIPLCGAGLKSA
jgi:threonine synthase